MNILLDSDLFNRKRNKLIEKRFPGKVVVENPHSDLHIHCAHSFRTFDAFFERIVFTVKLFNLLLYNKTLHDFGKQVVNVLFSPESRCFPRGMTFTFQKFFFHWTLVKLKLHCFYCSVVSYFVLSTNHVKYVANGIGRNVPMFCSIYIQRLSTKQHSAAFWGPGSYVAFLPCRKI